MERAGLLEGDCSVATFIEDFARLRGRPIALVEFARLHTTIHWRG
ncbi:hypothetical protein [Nocardia terpenica]|nr:hypothetical protein [Nocardia terpenica]